MPSAGDNSVLVSAAAQLPTQAPPKVKAGQATLPSYATTAKPNTKSPLQLIDRRLFNTDITTLRTAGGTSKVIREFVRSSPDLSAAITAYVRVGITNGHTAVANNPDGTINAEATALLAQIITRLTVVNDYSIGFDDAPSMRSVSETWAREVMIDGAMSGELVLDASRLPYKVQPVATSQIEMMPSKDGKRVTPRQKIAGNYIDLNVPTFFMVSLDQDTTTSYPTSPIEPSIQAVLFSAEFMNDLRKVVKRAIHPRVVVTIDEKKFRDGIPLEIQQDPEKVKQHLNSVLADLQSTINDLEPEEALVVFDSIGIEVTDHGNTNLSSEWKVIQDYADSKLAAGSKTLPTVLGHNTSTSDASADVLMFMKYVEGMVWGKLNEMWSKVLTLAVRLFGYDVYVVFSYNEIDLRPANELEAFKAMKQSRVLELLSLGLLTDEEASIILTGHLPPKGYVPKSGTGFRPNSSSEPTGNGYNGASNDGSTLNQRLKPNTPTNPKSGNGGKPAPAGA